MGIIEPNKRVMNLKIYAEIVINSDALDIDKPFTYEVPEEMKDDIKAGQWVKVPFGIKNSITDGFVLSIKNDELIGIRTKKIKTIVKNEPLLTSDDIKIVEFLKENYLCKYIDGIRLLIPQGLLKGINNKHKLVVSVNDIKVPEEVCKKD